MKGRSALVGRWAAGLGVRGFEVATKLCLYFLAANVLGMAGSGLLFIAMTWGHLAATISRAGIDRALTRLVAAEVAVGQGLGARRLIVRGVLLVLGIGTVLGLATMAAAPLAADLLLGDPDAGGPLAASGLVIPAMAVTFTLAATLAGLDRTIAAQALQNVAWPAGMLAALGLGFRDPTHLILAQALTMGAAAFVALSWIALDREKLRRNGVLPRNVDALPSLAATAGPLYVVELVQVSIATVPTLLLGVFADARAVSIFSIAQRASMLVHVVLLSLGTVAAPRFASLHRVGNLAGLRDLNRQMQVAGTVLGGGVCVILALGASPLLELVGPGFVAGAAILAIMAAGQFIGSLYAVQDILLAMTGNGTTLRALNLLQLLAVAVLSVPLISQFGPLGAAIVTALATAQGGLGTAIAARALIPEAATLLAPALPRALHPLLRLPVP